MEPAIFIPDALANSVVGTVVPAGGRSRSRSLSREDRGRNDARTENPGTNLHVRGLNRDVDSRFLEEAFSKAGRVQKAEVVYDPHTRTSRGFGFVAMESPEEAEAAITVLNMSEIMGKVITVEKARRSRARTPTPGKYFGPPKSSKGSYPDGQYDPRPYDSHYTDRYSHRRSRDRSRSRGSYKDRDRRRERDYDYDAYDYRRGERGRDYDYDNRRGDRNGGYRRRG
ncbi:hypothetical protein E1B28_002153 [Marasmius oreades]|uniref:RRM domain-containing protein n=1 Tax=Marasmius oreades TaxID=181124 RepID=A0A9P7RMH3_9AGAR|nr:uncharacterized protein E1B28_002153 [Marasmius oreades]KAG7086190.1 hypothetical protein E1B28_002153 [Marasmius oreades]